MEIYFWVRPEDPNIVTANDIFDSQLVTIQVGE
jgi:hypothetical protein